MIKNLLKTVALLSVAFVIISCASVSVDVTHEHATHKMPDLIYVEQFGTKGSQFNVDRDGQELVDFQKNLELMLQTGSVEDLTNKLVLAHAATPANVKKVTNAWLIKGKFVRVNQGSRALRMGIGFGAGGTKVETQVEVYDLATKDKKPFMVFSTTGGSGAEPGAISALSLNPLYLAIGAVAGVAHGLSEDTARTSRMITAQCSDYMYRSGWIPKDKWIEPKHLDKD